MPIYVPIVLRCDHPGCFAQISATVEAMHYHSQGHLRLEIRDLMLDLVPGWSVKMGMQRSYSYEVLCPTHVSTAAPDEGETVGTRFDRSPPV